jgi:hypothetical protein
MAIAQLNAILWNCARLAYGLVVLGVVACFCIYGLRR